MVLSVYSSGTVFICCLMGFSYGVGAICNCFLVLFVHGVGIVCMCCVALFPHSLVLFANVMWYCLYMKLVLCLYVKLVCSAYVVQFPYGFGMFFIRSLVLFA